MAAPTPSNTPKLVLILGSGPDAPSAAEWPRNRFSAICVLNTAHRIRPDWRLMASSPATYHKTPLLSPSPTVKSCR